MRIAPIICFAPLLVCRVALAQPALPNPAPESEAIPLPAIQAPFGNFLLIRQESHCVALRFTAHPEPEPHRARYEWYAQDDGSQNFKKANVQYGAGEVFEKVVTPDGSENVTVKAGSFALQWSASDWIYFPRLNFDSLMSMAPTTWTRLQDVDAQSKALRWVSGGNLVAWGPENAGLKLGAWGDIGQSNRIGSNAFWRLLVRNVSQKPITIVYFEPAFFDATPKVTDAVGRTVNAMGPVINAPVAEMKKVLAPGDTFDLCAFTLCFGSAPAGNSAWLTILKAPPGKYSLTFTYRLQNQNKEAGQGVLTSGTMPLTVRPALKP